MVAGFVFPSYLQRSTFTTNSETLERRTCDLSAYAPQLQARRSWRVAKMAAAGGEQEHEENVMQGPALAPSKPGVSTVGLSETESAFIEACYGADVDKIGSMLDDGVAADVSDVNGRTALHFCAGNGLPTLCSKLLDKGATIDKQDVLGFTPLHMATGYIKVDTAKLLVEQGADANIASFAGKLPVEIAEDMLEKTPAKRFFVANPNYEKLKEMVQVLDDATELEEDEEEEEEPTDGMSAVNEIGEITEETENAKFVVRVKAKGEASENVTAAVKVDDVKVTIRIKEPEKKT